MSDPINYHPHSRYTLHEKAELFPFRDLIWNKTDGPFFDLKVDFPDPRNVYADGTAYIRVEDVVELAHCLGMSTREETEALKEEIASLKAQLEELPKKVENFKNGLSDLTGSFVASLFVHSDPVEKSKEVEPAASESERKVLTTVKTVSEGTERDTETGSESDSSEGTNDVPSVASSDDPFAGLFSG